MSSETPYKMAIREGKLLERYPRMRSTQDLTSFRNTFLNYFPKTLWGRVNLVSELTNREIDSYIRPLTISAQIALTNPYLYESLLAPLADELVWVPLALTNLPFPLHLSNEQLNSQIMYGIMSIIAMLCLRNLEEPYENSEVGFLGLWLVMLVMHNLMPIRMENTLLARAYRAGRVGLAISRPLLKTGYQRIMSAARQLKNGTAPRAAWSWLQDKLSGYIPLFE